MTWATPTLGQQGEQPSFAQDGESTKCPSDHHVPIVAVTKRRATHAHSDSRGNSQPDWFQPLYGRVERRGVRRRSSSCRVTRHGRQLRAGNRTRDTSSGDPGKEGKDQTKAIRQVDTMCALTSPKTQLCDTCKMTKDHACQMSKQACNAKGWSVTPEESRRENYSRSQSLQVRKRIKDATSRRRQCAASLLVLE